MLDVPPIPTPRFELRSMSMAFMRALAARDLTTAETEIGASVPADLPDTLDNFVQFRIADDSEDPDAQPWLGRAIVLTDADGTDRIIGSCGFHSPPEPDGRVEIGYRVEPPWRRQGVATECVHALFDWAHEHGVDRFRASVSPGNASSANFRSRTPALPTSMSTSRVVTPALFGSWIDCEAMIASPS